MTILTEDGTMQADAELVRRIAALTPEQRRLLELRRKRQQETEPGRPRPLPRRQGTNEFPVSFAQERVWFLDRLQPGSATYNIPFHLRLAGDLDVGALRGALGEIVLRHEALRTTFAESGSGPLQVVAPALALEIPVVDLRALPPVSREAEAALWSAAEARRPFDLVHGPLLRMVLLRLADGEWSAVFTLHHIVGDGWSIEVLIREIAALYPARLAGRPSPLPELPIQYADYAEWQRGRLAGPALAAQLDYWRQRLAAAPAVSQLPTDRPRPPVQRFHGQSVRQELPAALLPALRRLAQGENASLFMGVLAAFYTLLARHSGAADLTVGTPVAGRTRAELEDLIGLFLNTLVLRLRLQGDPSFSELLAQVRELSLGAFAHQDLPFAKLVAELATERDLSHTPLFQVQMVLMEADFEELHLPGLTLSTVALEESTSKLDLTLRAHARRDGLELVWLYNTDLFDEATIRRLGAHFATLLAAVVNEPGRALADLPLLSAAESQQLLEWNDTAAQVPAGACLQELIAAQVERTPQAVAVSCAGEALTYRELDGAANALARRLEGAGAVPETVVGVLAERSLEMVVGLLAVLKAGGAYLPLDPDYPAERLAFMLEDSRAPVVLAQERLLARLPEHRARVLSLGGAAAAREETVAARGAGPGSLAYVIYTSGSTGRPKGTMNTHRGIVNRLLWMQERYGLTPADRVLQKTPYSFDVSVWEFFWPLLAGARLVMARPGGHQDPAYLVRAIKDEGITTLHFVPSMLQVFLEAPGVEDCSSLRRTVCSGEALPAELERRFFERLPAAELHNLYGPTEAAVDVTSWACERDSRRSAVPIGYPVANTRIHIVDRASRPVPIGVAGELLIGGVQVGRGYLARPELTAERFVPDAFSATAGTRLYRTGDLARVLADGAVEFLGRIDYQVKLRGLRIELGEIESALAALPGVRAAVVMARADGGEARLVAYVVADPPPSLAEIRTALGRSLPEYMLPAALVVMESLPLTPSGKVDRKALPAPEGRRETATEPVAPRTPLEGYLAGLWQEILRVEWIGVHDDFFALGGTSISGAVLINRLQRELEEILHVVVIFDRPTVAQLAAYLAESHAPAVRRRLGFAAAGEAPGQAPAARVDEETLARLRAVIHEPPPLPAEIARLPKNPPALFVLAPPRSGTTLLRVMLGGHPSLFAPPELELLEFDTLRERRDAFGGRDAFRREGLIRAVMEARGASAEEAKALVEDLEERGATVGELYRLLQSWIGGRMLVDKTPTYAWSLSTLARAEAGFAGARYVHLLRHPYAAIASFEEARIEQVFFPRAEGFTRRQLAEMSWLLAQRNILEFLAAIPAERRRAVRFEDLVAEPERVLRELCGFLGLAYDPDMAEPYKDKSARMTDGLHAESRMLGDVKFHQHSRVDARAAGRWRELAAEDFLGAETRRLAAHLGYQVEPERESWAPIPRLMSDGPLPLSFAQERLWFLDRLEPGSSAYNLVNALRLAGRLRRSLLARALAEVVRRHAALRTTLAETAAGPVQVVGPVAAPPLPLVDLASLPTAQREEEARRRVQSEARRPFDLAQGPLARALLLRLAPEEHVVVLNLHHIVSDGWSMGVLVREVAALYNAFAQGLAAPLPELPIQYGDFAVWQRQRLQGDALGAQVGYWRQRLRGVPPLDLPTDRPRRPVQTLRGAQLPVAFPAELTAAAAAFGRREQTTAFMTLLAAFAVLLHRYSGQTDLAVGTPHANRDRPEIEPLIGFFINTLTLRLDVAGEPTFRAFLGRVRELTVGAFAHHEVPFEKIVEELRPERDLARSPLFQVMFILQNNAGDPLELPGLTVAPFTFEPATAKFELTLMLFEAAGGLAGSLEYNTDLFEPATIERLAGHLGRLLESAVTEGERPLGELPLLSAAESAQLAAWNETVVARPPGTLIHDLFAAQAARTPQAVAVSQDGESLTYGELEARSNQLARRLRRLGVGPEVAVGLRVERTPRMVVALLGILKAGGAYVPLDPSHPAERLRMVVEDSAIRVLVTEESLSEAAAESAAALERSATAENLAYVIYTSGSTGRPKGVQLPHRAVVNFLFAMLERPGLTAADVVPALTTISFDIAGLEIYLPLAVGARIEMVKREEAADGARLSARLAACGATVLQATPATWRLLLDSGWPGDRALKALCGGEALPRDLAESLLARVGELWNLYGPTETAIWSAAGQVVSGDGPVLLGAPIANTAFYVVDQGLQPVPVGVPGELWIAGDGVARGYLGRPDLTAERFVPDPFAARPGARLYRTGDLVRWRPSGELEFLGRIDHQVKVRGFRIELGEIEAALLCHDSVREAVVVVREDGAGKRLVAYLVAAGERPPAGDLRQHLKDLLPDYMIPAAFVVLEALPLTPSGKVDRKTLPARQDAMGTNERRVAPEGPVEELVAGIWAEVLRREGIGAEDNFFDLGGHSLLATQVMSRIRGALAVELPLQRLFGTPTVRGFARAVEEARRAGAAPSLPPISPAPRDAASLPLSFAQERLWFLQQLDPSLTAYNLVQVLRLRGVLDPGALELALAAVVRRHESLRTVFVTDGGGARQLVQPPGALPLARIDLRGLAAGTRAAEVERCARDLADRPLDLTSGPLFRLAVIELAPEDSALVLLVHHIVADGWSLRLIVGELGALYAAAIERRPSPLPELPIQYGDFAVWQRRWLSGEWLAAQLEFWRGHLAGAPPLLELPTDRPRPALQSSRGARRAMTVEPETSRQVQEVSRRRGLTPFMTLLATFETLLWRYTGAADLVVGVPIANRTRAELENLIGTFVNMLVLRTRIPGQSPSFAELATQIRGVSLGAFAHQDLPFERLVDELQPERSLSYPPLFQVMFNLQNQPQDRLELPGLTLTSLPAARSQSQVDLTFAIGESLEGEGLLEGYFELNTDLFDAATIERMIVHFGNLLAGVTADPERALAALPLLSAAEIDQLRAWNDTALARPAGTLIHELFAAQAARTPLAVAVSQDGASLTYGELEERSNRLAHRLRRLGVGPEVRVGLCLERTPEMVVALLGILKAGGAYVPLDPSHPAERLQMVVEDSALRVLVTEESLSEAAAESATPLERSATAENLAYVIYTSGSTGRPKGVQLPHRAVVNFLLAMLERPRLTAADVVPALTTISFDIAGLEIYLPLAVGARIEMVKREEAADGVLLAVRLQASGATVLQATPATWRLLLDSGWPGDRALKALCGGEALPRELAEALLPRVGELWNVYGPTETAVWSSIGRVNPGDGPVLLGAPIANTAFYVVDAGLEPVPVGVPGELWIAGDGVARGYLGRPDLTAEKFVPDPFAARPGARLYRTGDLVRWRPAGELEFLGRIDHQVKVRGFRIELGEIEAALLRHQGVGAAVVVVREDGADKRLVAYLVAGQESPPASGLREHLRRLLPDYMIPAAFVVLDALPLTPSGKVDRKALPAPQDAIRTSERRVAPEGPVEELVAGIWAEVLRREEIGAEDNFFDLGGHSLLATQVMSRLRAALGVELPLQRLFETPTVRGLTRVAEQARREGALSLPPISPERRAGDLPLSFAQERMWFLQRLDPRLTAYNLVQSVRLRGTVEPRALERAVAALARRHEVLRTAFEMGGGGPRQIVHPRVPAPFVRIDLRRLAAELREGEIERCAERLAAQPCDLAVLPLFRTVLIELAEDESALVIFLHHIVADGWSIRRMIGELAILYAADREGRPSPLPDLPIQYGDFAVWQRRWLAGERLAAQLAFWSGHLAGAPPLLELPTDRPRPALQSSRGARHGFAFAAAAAQGIKEISRRRGLTPFMTLLAVFESLLWRYTHAADLVVGIPIANRNRAEIENLIGTFVNMLALRSRIGERAPAFAALAEQVREVALGAFAHQDLPFEKLVDELRPERSLSYSPLFQVMFNFQNQPMDRLELPGLIFETFSTARSQAQADLTLAVAEAPDGGRLEASLEYNSDLFDAATVERMAVHLLNLLAAVLADPERTLAALPLLAAAERSQLLTEWNETAMARPRGRLIHELFEAQAARTPLAAAVSQDGEILTYGDLEERSNRLAHRLRRLGVGPEVRVGLCLERTPQTVVALLGILKAGGAYVPLDPAHPAERLALVIADAELAVLVTEERWLSVLPPHDARTVCLDRDRPAIDAESVGAPARTAADENLAYVIYTSGSTGRPKGVQLPHRAVVNFLLAMLQRPGLTASDVVPAVTTLTFDIAGLEIYLPLAVGGRVEVIGRDEAADGALFAARLKASGATALQATPAAWRLLLDAGWQGDRALKALCGGEALPRELAAALLPRVGELWNVYGPTETAIWSAVGRVDPGDGPVLLGAPIGNTRFLVLDRDLEPVPVGVAGELWIAGDGVARGYLGRPDLTAEKFVPAPFAAAPGARLYRTGDLVRWRPSGELEFLGRIDHQVKVRGFRIELGEIEAALLRHPSVGAAVVVVREDAGDKRLVAYLVADGEGRPAAGELRRHLKDLLPDYMMPAAFVVLDALPLTPSGKVDRKALPAPEGTRESALTTAYVDPRSELERTIAAVWRDVLKLDRVGAGDNFFDLGGHSLLAAQVHARLGEILGRELALVDLFRYPTVASLAAFLGGAVEPTVEAGLARAAARRQAAGLGREAVAIIGMAGRFPGAGDVEAFWENLRNGVESISFFDDETLRAAGVAGALLADPRYVRAYGIVPGADEFDAPFFGYSPREAEIIDPQQRVFLECAWEAFEDAGHEPARFPGDVGVFAGAGMNTYIANFLSNPELVDAVGALQLMISNDKDFLATRVSYKLGLTGPSMSVQTACSTSLVAVHLACQSLLAGECDAALAGGVTLRLPQTLGYRHQAGSVLSPDGHCRAFDAAAGGFVGGNGAAAVLLRRLSDALRDGDSIRAVIRGSAVNNDGSRRAGYTAPGVDGQARVVAQALAVAGVEPESIGYVEAHGTGTELGDPIEVAALQLAFGSRAPRGGCLLGSVKTNVGHLDSAAGVTSLIKAALALERRQIPPTLHFERPNPKLRLEESPFRVADRLTDWPASSSPRRAGVSSLGIGGTNAHVVLEEAPATEPGSASRPWQLLFLSARTPTALATAADRFAAFLREHPEVDFADAIHTLQTGRRSFPQRLALVCRDREDALSALAGDRSPRLLRSEQEDAGRPVTFLFSGLGEHYPGMARDLYAAEPTFRAELDRCCELLLPHLGVDLRRLLFPDGAAPGASAGPDLRAMLGRSERPASELDRTLYAQPAVFAVEYALASLLMAWGIRPQSLIGYSLGEYVAACLSGVFPLADALALVARRARLIDGLPAGAMLAVPLPEEEARGLLGEELSVAAVNGASLTVASGPDPAIADLERRLAERGLAGRRLPTTHAFHSRMMEPIREAFAGMVAGLRPAAPRIPYVSNVTGTWITAEEATDPGYWVRHLCQSVRFADGLAELSREPERVLVEVGPGQGLTALALQSQGEILAIPTLRSSWDRQPDTAFLLTALAKLWLAGLGVDWAGFYAHERRRRMPLPTYPFERRRYFVEPASSLPRPDAASPSRALAASRHARPAHLRNAYVPPAGGLERRLTEVWQEILGIAEVGAHDNFFDLGGHSLLATQMMSRLRDELALDLGLDAVFDSPTVAGLARRIEESRGRSPEALRPAITRVSAAGPLPLSFSQERLWFLHQLSPLSSAFNLAQDVRLRGELDVASLGRCFGELVRRHEALRTVFRVEDGGPVQVVQPPAPLPLPVVDLAALAARDRDAEARRLAADHQALPFDLASDRLLRIALLRFGDRDHALLLTIHHVVSDGWSFGVLVRELVALYRAFAAGAPSPLPELAAQYPDFAAWQRRVLAGETLQAEIDWWRARLAGDPPPLRLAADRRRAGVQEFKLEWETLDLPAELTAELHALSRRRSASLYMALLAGWKGLLARLTAEEDILLGAPIANRNRAEVEGLIGFFLNTLLLRTDLAGNPRFGDVLNRVRETALGAFAHQDLPLEMVLQAVHPERDADRMPFQIMFLLQNAPLTELAVPGLTFSVLDAEQRLGDLGTAAFEVGLTLAELADGRGLAASITYNGLLFDRATVVRLLERYGRLLTAAVANPERRLWDLDLLAAAERDELLGGGAAAAAATAFVPVHRAFEQRAAAAPEEPAVIAGERRLTYGELDRWSNRLANALGDLGVGPERAVGVAIERSPELLVALLAVLKAGAAYVPLDPSYPPERLTYILEDAGAAVLLTTAAVLAAAPALGEGRALPLLLESGVLDEGREDRPEVEADAENLAYLIYTSGSTGRPKGVMVRHGALAGYAAAFRDEHRLGPRDRVLQFASIGFDTSAEEIYPCLASGAALVLRDDAMLASTPGFLRACGELGVTVLDLPTAFWHEMTARLAEETVELPPALRLIILGGERVLPERLAAWHGFGYTGVRLVNTYGPTETTIVATRCELAPGLAVPGEVPIGRPVPGARAYVADPFLELAPVGVPGELCVGGAGLARGYLGRPGLTAERFVPDPWAEQPGARLYRTGDLVRRLPSGDLEFLGRADDQVKVRGYRVELREIEASLGLHAGVAEAVVVAREGASGDRRLAAYVVPRNGAAPAAELRAFLRDRLPEYMVPADFVTLEGLPKTPSGKVDRRALPAPERLQPAADGGYTAPRTPAEETVAAIWSEVLGRERVGVTDNFFELGGHSLLLPQVTHRLRTAFQVEIPLRALFDEPTVERLALVIEEILVEDIERQLGALEGADSLAG